MEAVSRHQGLGADGMMIVVPSSPDEIIAEGQAFVDRFGQQVLMAA